MTIEVVLNKYETFQIQDLSDLTGVHVVSSLPVAVFSGNVETEEEQRGERRQEPPGGADDTSARLGEDLLQPAYPG